MVSRSRVIYHPRPSSTPEAELDALSAVYALALRRRHDSKKAPEPDGRNDASIRNGKEVSDVDQGPDKPSEIVVTHLRED